MRKYICSLIIVLTVFLLLFSVNTFGIDDKEKELCQRVFGKEKGNIIYEAYEKIANLKYVPEEEKVDDWQTPFETEKLKTGDCEDAVFLFASNLSDINGELVWGFIIYNDNYYTNIVKAHVWYELKDEKENIYIVEGFRESGLSGIIPMYTMYRTEERQIILKISQEEFNELQKEEKLEVFQTKAEQHSRIDAVMLGLNTNKNISQYADITSRRKIIPMYTPTAMFKYFPESWGKSDFDKAMAKDKEIHKIYEKLYELMNNIRNEKGE